MTVTLSPDAERLVEKQLQSGRYASADQVVAAALALLTQESSPDFATGELDELLAAAERSIEQEGTLDGDEAFQARLQARARARSKAG